MRNSTSPGSVMRYANVTGFRRASSSSWGMDFRSYHSLHRRSHQEPPYIHRLRPERVLRPKAELGRVRPELSRPPSLDHAKVARIVRPVFHKSTGRRYTAHASRVVNPSSSSRERRGSIAIPMQSSAQNVLYDFEHMVFNSWSICQSTGRSATPTGCGVPSVLFRGSYGGN